MRGGSGREFAREPGCEFAREFARELGRANSRANSQPGSRANSQPDPTHGQTHGQTHSPAHGQTHGPTLPAFKKLTDDQILACGVGACPTHQYKHIQFKFGRFECSVPTGPGQWCNTPVDGAPPQLINPGISTPTEDKPEELPGLVNSDNPAGDERTGYLDSFHRRYGRLPWEAE